MTPEQAIEQAERGELRPIYLVMGEEEHQRAAVLQALRAAATRGGVPGLNEDALVAGEVDVDAVLSAARTMPMMAKRRFVSVRSVERWDSKGAAALDRLAEYATDPATTTTLVLVAGKMDKRRKLVGAARKAGWLVECNALSPRALPQWIVTRASEQGSRLAPGVADLIAELVGPELGPVADAVDRLCLYVGEGKEIDEAAVEACLVRLRPATVWELVGAVGRRDLGAALGALERVYDPQDRGLRLVGVLAWSTRQMLRFEAAMREGAAPPEAAKRAGAPPFKARELSEQVKRIPRAELESWLETLAGVDLALKGGSKRRPKAVLEQAVINLCSSPRTAQRRRRARSGA